MDFLKNFHYFINSLYFSFFYSQRENENNILILIYVYDRVKEQMKHYNNPHKHIKNKQDACGPKISSRADSCEKTVSYNTRIVCTMLYAIIDLN